MHHSDRGISNCVYMQPVSETVRHSHRRSSMKKSVFKNFAKFTGKHLCQSFFFRSLFFNSVYTSSSSNIENKEVCNFI